MNDIEYVESYPSSRFEIDNSGIIKYGHTGKEVRGLSILLDLDPDGYCALKYGEYQELQPHLQKYDIKIFKYIKLISIPKEMYIFIDIIFDISATDKWINLLMSELSKDFAIYT